MLFDSRKSRSVTALTALEAPQTNFQETLGGESVEFLRTEPQNEALCPPRAVCHTLERGLVTLPTRPPRALTVLRFSFLRRTPRFACVPCFAVAPGNQGNTRNPKFRLVARLGKAVRRNTTCIFFPSCSVSGFLFVVTPPCVSVCVFLSLQANFVPCLF